MKRPVQSLDRPSYPPPRPPQAGDETKLDTN